MGKKKLLFGRNKQNMIFRSDNAVIYDDLHDCLDAVTNDYGSELTQDVVVTVGTTSTFKNTDRFNFPDFYYHLEDFNTNSNFFLTINGNDKLTMDGNTLGSFKFTNCSNIIIANTRFINISSLALKNVPEQTCAVFAQGTSTSIIKNIVVTNCTVDGVSYIDGELNQGRHAFIFKYLENASVIDTTIKGMSSYAFDIIGLGSLSLTNVTYSDGIVNHYILAQPSIINIKSTELLYIEDCDFDMELTEGCVVSSNLIRLITKRTNYRNSNGEVFRLQGSVRMRLLDIESCIFDNNLKNPFYEYIKQNIAYDTIDKITFINNTVKLTAIRGNTYFSRFMWGKNVEELNVFNNFNNNSSESIMFTIVNYLGAYNSDYNVYHDVLTNNNDTLSNKFLDVENETSPVYLQNIKSLSTLQESGRDIESTFIPFNTEIFNTTLDNVTVAISSLSADDTKTPTYDYNKQLIGILHPGAGQEDSTTPIIDNVFTFNGIDTFSETNFDYSAQYQPFSNNNLIFISQSNKPSTLFKWEFEDEDTNITTYYGNALNLILFSKLDNENNYIGTLTYNINLTDVTI